MQPGHVVLRLLAVAARDHRLALVVHLEHELRRAGEVVPEELLEDERHVGHEVDRVVPDDHDPGPVVLVLVGGARLLDLDLGGSESYAHHANCGCASRVAATDMSGAWHQTCLDGEGRG